MQQINKQEPDWDVSVQQVSTQVICLGTPAPHYSPPHPTLAARE